MYYNAVNVDYHHLILCSFHVVGQVRYGLIKNSIHYTPVNHLTLQLEIDMKLKAHNQIVVALQLKRGASNFKYRTHDVYVR